MHMGEEDVAEILCRLVDIQRDGIPFIGMVCHREIEQFSLGLVRPKASKLDEQSKREGSKPPS
jgi:hypothetical protein